MNVHDPLVQFAIAVIVAVVCWFISEYEIRIERDDDQG